MISINSYRSRAITLLFLVFLLFSSIIIPLKWDSIRTQLDHGNLKDIEEDQVRSTALTNYLGIYVRGESYVNISGSLVDQNGEPVANTDIFVFLNISDDEAIFIGTYKTDINGSFNISFLLPINVPEGNRTITIYSEPNLRAGIGDAWAYYWLYVCSRVHVNVLLEKNEAAFFENNASFSISVIFDNGSVVQRENMLISVSVIHESMIENASLRTGPDGVARGIVNFTSVGEYTIEAVFNTSEPDNYLGDFVLADGQYVVDGSILGETLSTDIGTLSVYLADRIILNFENTQSRSLQVIRGEASISILGRYLNISGFPDRHLVNLSVIYLGTNDNYYELFVSKVLWSDVDGYFKYNFEVNESFLPGRYIISCDDVNESTVDIVDPLDLSVFSNISLNIVYMSPNVSATRISSGSLVEIFGYVRDGIDGTALEGVTIKGILVDNSLGREITLNQTNTDIEGSFILMLVLPETFESGIITLKILAEGLNYYLSAEREFSFEVYNHLILRLRIGNNSYIWSLREGLALAQNDTVLYNIEFPANLTAYFVIVDDFGRRMNVSSITILVNDTGVAEFFNISEAIFYLVNINSTTNITLIIGDLDVSVSLLVLGRFLGSTEGTGPLPNIPFFAILVISILAVPLILITLMSEIKVITHTRSESEKDIFGIILNIERAGMERKFLEMAAFIRAFFNKLATDNGISVSSYLTTREIYQLILEKNEEFADAKDHLEFLLHCYEKIVYGFKRLSDRELQKLKTVISDIYIFLKSLIARRENKNA